MHGGNPEFVFLVIHIILHVPKLVGRVDVEVEWHSGHEYLGPRDRSTFEVFECGSFCTTRVDLHLLGQSSPDGPGTIADEFRPGVRPDLGFDHVDTRLGEPHAGGISTIGVISHAELLEVAYNLDIVCPLRRTMGDSAAPLPKSLLNPGARIHYLFLRRVHGCAVTRHSCTCHESNV